MADAAVVADGIDENLRRRFWAKVTIIYRQEEDLLLPDDRACWPWMGAKCGGRPGGGAPYGTIRLTGNGSNQSRQKKAHVVSFALARGYWPEQDVCHTCDFTLCVNPSHLVEGSHRYNMLDYLQKYGRLGVPKHEWPTPPRPQLPFDDEVPF